MNITYLTLRKIFVFENNLIALFTFLDEMKYIDIDPDDIKNQIRKMNTSCHNLNDKLSCIHLNIFLYLIDAYIKSCYIYIKRDYIIYFKIIPAISVIVIRMLLLFH